MAQNEKKFTTRERLAIHLVVLLLKMIQPFQWSHEFSSAIEPIEKLLAEKGE